LEIETGVANYLAAAARTPVPKIKSFMPASFCPSPDQLLALDGALSSPVSIITGGPGSGKTRLIGHIVTCHERAGVSWAAAAFTGKAVARVKQVLGRSADEQVATIHRWIIRARREKDKIPFKTLIIDEASMVTTELFWQLVSAFTHKFRLILVGDVHQLPPISWGSLFFQCLESGQIPTFRLTANHRVLSETIRLPSDEPRLDGATNDGILDNARAIVGAEASEEPRVTLNQASNFSLVAGGVKEVGEIIRECREAGVSLRDLVVVCPYNRDLADINAIFQDTYGKDQPSVGDYRDRSWAVGDRVMMTENDYTLGVMNGELGFVSTINRNEIAVDFGYGTFRFSLAKGLRKKDLPPGVTPTPSVDSLTQAFALSVHRFQGSEADYVIVYVPTSPETSFLNKNLIYTALTRARRRIWVVGDLDLIMRAAGTPGPIRHERLAQRLRQLHQVSQ
jgi:exodeoxyribonuclease V alpha subunit